MSISKRDFLFSFAALAMSIAALPLTAQAGGDCCAPQKTAAHVAACCKPDAKCCQGKSACCITKAAASCCKDKAACCKTNQACCKADAKKASCCATNATCCADKKNANAKPMACCAAKSPAKPKAGTTPAPAHQH